MRLFGQWCVAVLATAGVVVSAHAADRSKSFEIAGFGGWATGGQFKVQGAGAIVNGDVTSTGSRVGLDDHSAFALTAGLRTDDKTQYELFYSRQATQLKAYGSETDVTVSYLHLDGTLLLSDGERAVQPYAIGGLGITRLTPGDNGTSKTRPSAALGLGLRWAATDHFSLRLEGRGMFTLMNNNTVFCKSDQAGLLCRVRSNGTSFIQGQLLAGVAFAF